MVHLLAQDSKVSQLENVFIGGEQVRFVKESGLYPYCLLVVCCIQSMQYSGCNSEALTQTSTSAWTTTRRTSRRWAARSFQLIKHSLVNLHLPCLQYLVSDNNRIIVLAAMEWLSYWQMSSCSKEEFQVPGQLQVLGRHPGPCTSAASGSQDRPAHGQRSKQSTYIFRDYSPGQHLLTWHKYEHENLWLYPVLIIAGSCSLSCMT
jgi:hypothetical protein